MASKGSFSHEEVLRAIAAMHYDQFGLKSSINHKALFNKKNNLSIPIEAGIISFKNLKSGLLKFNYGTRFDNDSAISEDVLNNYKLVLENILMEIINPNMNFIEKKLPKKNYV